MHPEPIFLYGYNNYLYTLFSMSNENLDQYKKKIGELEKELNSLKTTSSTCLPSMPNINFPENLEKKPTSKNIKASLRVYPTATPNSKGYHISNYAVVVGSEEYPFTTLDSVDYFLENLLKYIKNAKLSITSEQKKSDNQFFQSYELPLKEIVPAITMKAGSSHHDRKKKKHVANKKTRRHRKKSGATKKNTRRSKK